ncbi:hypothetical protein Acr_05g0012860 [Actinidia rufa]|uniref:Uncharacterized protein n=1 Tax=Actinidia rufa TaxID=165716 RepID=A0A7J0EQ00_9ERIC|nr:hypothetical protein Acr_05g0012860 [Actinidia rufa]
MHTSEIQDPPLVEVQALAAAPTLAAPSFPTSPRLNKDKRKAPKVPHLAVVELGTQVSTANTVHDHDTCLTLAQAIMLL